MPSKDKIIEESSDDFLNGESYHSEDNNGNDKFFFDDEGSSDMENDFERAAALEQELEAEKIQHLEAEFKESLQSGADEQAYDLDADISADPKAIISRIQQIVTVLGNFKNLRKEGVPRARYLERLTHDLVAYYNYNSSLVEMFLKLFGPEQCVDFFEANEKQRPLTIRVNTLKTKRRDLAQALINRGVNLDPVGDWCKAGLQVYESQVPMGATPEYLLGHYMIQAASSWLPVVALDPKPNTKVADFAAAPGGKTTHIAMMMRNTGTLYANDINKDRCVGLISNVHRLGCTNVITTAYDGRKFPINNLDYILLDAPCSGTGVISRDPSIKLTKDYTDVTKTAHLQREILLRAIDCLKVGGEMVYSTCSITVEENEAVVDYALKKRNVRIVPISNLIPFGEKGFKRFEQNVFHPSMEESRRVYPHMHNMDGFYVCKLVKLGEIEENKPVQPPSPETNKKVVSQPKNKKMPSKNKASRNKK